MREAVYKGATRPATKWGVPLTPLVAGLGGGLLVGVWIAYAFGYFFGMRAGLFVAALIVAVLVAAFLWMRRVTKIDDQRLRRMWIRFKLNRRNPNRKLWGGRSYSAHQPRRKTHVRI